MAVGPAGGSQGLAAEDVSPWLKPLLWTNPASSHSETAPPALPKVKSRWLKPLKLRADTKVSPRPDEYSANEPDFERISQPFQWANPQDAAPQPQPQNAAEQIEFEKQHFAWIRPFYWDNVTESAATVSLEQEYLGTDGQQISNIWTKPLHWRNDARPYPWWRVAAVPNAPGWLADSAKGLYRLPPVGGRDAQLAGAGSQPRTVAFMYQEQTLPGPKKDESEELPEALKQDGEISERLAAPAEHPPVDSDAEDLGGRLPFEDLEQDDQLDGEVLGEDKGVIAEAETLGTEPDESYALQFLRSDTVLLDPGEAQFDYGVTYTLADVTLPFINSSSELEHARFRQRQLLVPLEIRYGLARRLQLFANVPFGWSNVELSLSDQDDFVNDGGIGDITFGGTLLLREGDQCCSDLVWTNACSMPTGLNPFETPTIDQPGVPTLGYGTWTLSSNLLWIRNYDPVVIFYGFGTRQSFEREVEGVTIRPGQQYNYQLGVGFAVNSKVTFSTRFSGAYITEDRRDGVRVPGTIREPMSISLSVTVDRCHRLIEPFVDFGLTDESINSSFGIIWTRY